MTKNYTVYYLAQASAVLVLVSKASCVMEYIIGLSPSFTKLLYEETAVAYHLIHNELNVAISPNIVLWTGNEGRKHICKLRGANSDQVMDAV